MKFVIRMDVPVPSDLEEELVEVAPMATSRAGLWG